MKLYEIDTEFTFGKYQGKTVEDVLDKKDHRYLVFCFLNLDHFVLDIDVVRRLKGLISDKIRRLMKIEYGTYKNEVLRDLIDEKDLNYIPDDSPDDRWIKDYYNSYNDDLDFDQQDPEFWNQF